MKKTDLDQEANKIYFGVYDKEVQGEPEYIEGFYTEEEAMNFVTSENAAYGYKKFFYKEETKDAK